MKYDEMNMDEILKRYLPRAPKEEMEAAGERVLRRLQSVAARMASGQEQTKTETLRRVDQLVLTAAYLLRNAGDLGSITDKVNELSADVVRFGTVFAALDRLERRGLLLSWFGDPTPELDGESEQYFRVTPAGESALAQARVEAKHLMDAFGDLV